MSAGCTHQHGPAPHCGFTMEELFPPPFSYNGGPYRLNFIIYLRCQSGDRKRTVEITLEGDQANASPERLQFFKKAVNPVNPEFRMMELYADNIALEFANSGKIPHGITLQDAQPGPSNAPCNDLFFLSPMSYDPITLSLKVNGGIYHFGQDVEFASPEKWIPLDSRTWPTWWSMLDARYHISELMAQPQPTISTRPTRPTRLSGHPASSLLRRTSRHFRLRTRPNCW